MLDNSKANQQLIQFKISSGLFNNLDDINAKVTPTKYLELHESRWIGNTALHFLSDINDMRFKDSLNATLSKKADYTIKNRNGSTVLHLMLQCHVTYNEVCCTKFRNVLRVPSINTILSTHVNMKNSTNPCDSNGMSHFHIACMANHVEAVEFFLDNNVSIDHAISCNSPYFAGFTGLHLAIRCCCLQVTKLLLEHGANINLENSEKKTAVYLVMENHLAFASDMFLGYFDHTDLPKKHANEAITRVLLEISNANSKIIDDSALSSLYIARVIMNNLVSEKILTKEDINRSINIESAVWPSYTAMHFAALTDCKTVQFFLKSGADLLVKDLNGIRPFDLIVDRYSVEEISNIIALDSVCRKITCSRNPIKLSNLVSAIKDFNQFESFLKSCPRATRSSVPMKSPVWPGFTLMHLVVLFSKLNSRDVYTGNLVSNEYLQMIRELHDKNANAIIAQDSHGRTPLHMSFRLGKMGRNVGDLLLELLLDNPINLVDEDDLSHLHIACTKYDKNLAEKLSSGSINVNLAYKGKSIDQTIETGWTPLHVAVSKNSTDVVKVLLKYGADVHRKDINGVTPIHLIVLSNVSLNCAESLLSVRNLRESIVEGTGLSHLHAACSEENDAAVRKLLDSGSDINLKITYQSKIADKSFKLTKLINYVGYTPLQMLSFPTLHPCFYSNSEELKCLNTLDLLIRRGANIFVEDSKDTSFLAKNLEYFASYLKEDANLQRQAEAKIGLTKIHLACFTRDLVWLKILLENDATDINTKLGMNFPEHAGFTPLHVIMADSYEKYQYSFIKPQIGNEADVDLSNVNQETQNVMDRDRYEEFRNEFIRLLLNNGADVTLSNANQQTPVHMAHTHYFAYHEHILRITMMLKAQKNFRINPTDIEGFSHFHIACRVSETTVVKKFLERGNFNVNQPTDFFALGGKFCLAGCTPLHLAAICCNKFIEVESQLETVDLLLKHGADSNFQNSRGNTPLHVAKRSEIFERIASCGHADTNIRNTKGHTPLGHLITDTCYRGCDREGCNSVSVDQIKNWLRCGCRYNAFDIFDKEGCIGLSITKVPFEELRSLFKIIAINMPRAMQIDEEGRTVIHNAVSVNPPGGVSITDYATLIELLAKAGYDIDSQDNLGRTALHVAAEFRNLNAASALLMLGADVNILDKQGRTALASQINCRPPKRYSCFNVLDCLIVHVKKLQFCQLAVHRSDESYVVRECDSIMVEKKFYTELEQLKNEPSLLILNSFISETNAVVHYSTMSESTKDIIDEFFHQDNMAQLRKQFSEIVGILNLQYRKAIFRSKLIKSAVASLNILGNFSIPELCSQLILKFLSNADLKNLIASTSNCQNHRQLILQKGSSLKNKKKQRLQ